MASIKFSGLGRRSATALASLAVLGLVVACGSAKTYDPLQPSRLVVFGTSMSFTDTASTTSSARYSVNDGSVNNWVAQVATNYGLAMASSTAAGGAGGSNYAHVNARVSVGSSCSAPAGCASVASISDQLNSFLGQDAFGAKDVAIIEGGMPDVIAQTRAVAAGTTSAATAVAAVQQAARDLANLVARAKGYGVKYVVVMGTYNLGGSPWATATGQGALLTSLSSAFNNELLVRMADPVTFANVQFIDTAYQNNLVINAPVTYGYTNSSTVVCAATDAADTLGIGAGEVNAALCQTATPTTLQPSGVDYTSTYNNYVFADKIHFTPAVHRALGTHAATKMRARW